MSLKVHSHKCVKLDIPRLVHDKRAKQLDAQCLRHKLCKPRCHVHRVLRRDPIGFLAAWLVASNADPYGETRASHFECRLDRSETGPVSYEMRLFARELARTQPMLAELFLLEETYGTGEEPLNL
jgi:hypothetical protein